MPKLEIVAELKEITPDQGWPGLFAYVFSRSGSLLSKQRLEQDRGQPTVGRASVEVDATGPVVVKIGPEVEDIAGLDRQNPVIKTYEIKPDQKNTIPIELLKPVWGCWIKKLYLVTGTVVKQEAGTTAPICIGEVDVYDVDVGCLLRLAEPLIERLRNALIDVIIDPPPVRLQALPWWRQWDDDDYCGTPPPRPRPLPDPQIVRKLESLPREWALATKRFNAVGTAKTRVGKLIEKMPLTERQTWLNREAAAGIKISDLLYSTTVQFQQMLVAKFESFRFWLCWYPWIYWLWWPWCWYSLEKLGTATLQPGGKFSLPVWLSICRTDVPDLWFVVRQTIGGAERVIYARHPVPCNTYWNHPSGKAVNLVVTDVLAMACYQPVPVVHPDPYVLPLGISTDEWYQIHQAHIKPPTLIDAQHGLYNSTDPYGTTLNFTMQFHDGLRGLNVWYYRWSYRLEGGSAWTPINTPIIQRYITVNAMGKYVIESEKLGPFDFAPESNLFLVRDPARDWIATDNVFAVWYTASWDGATARYSPLVADGNYELKLEMFNGAGAKVTPAVAGFKFMLLTSAGPGAPDDALHVKADGSIILRLYIDNRYTVADIESIAIGAVPAAECQFLEYTDKNTDKVGVTYVAYHPNGFLDHYDLTILRGISATVEGSKSSPTAANSPTTEPFAVKDLLDTFDRCAFAAELHTWPTTRDGVSRIRAYEAHDTSAFALVKK